METRINEQISFLKEVDALKSINRATYLANRSRKENSAEHSWHVALFALIFAEQAKKEVDLFKAIKMLLLHDIVEVDVGDNPIFGSYNAKTVADSEAKAADRIFGLLPADQASEMQEIWLEFESAATATAQFAKSMDRFQAPTQNLISKGGSWQDYDVNYELIEKKVGSQIALAAPNLWAWLKPRIKAFLSD